MKKGEVQVIVAGVSGVGKSTVMQLIRNSLIHAGISCSFVTDQEFVDGGHQDHRIESMIKKGVKVIVEERPVRHSLTEENYEIVKNP